MLITSTPFRISFFGGGTDYPTYFQEHGGSVLSTSINRYCHIHARFLPPFFEHSYRVVWSKIETCNTIEEIEHPAVRAALRHLNSQHGVEVHHFGDLPARAGMGSSSSFAVGLLNALHTLSGKMRSKRQLAEEAIYLEQTLLKETVGVQDQIAAAFGGFNRIEIENDGQFTVAPVSIFPNRRDALQDRLLLFYTGVSRIASTIALKQVEATRSKAKVLHEMRGFVDEGVRVLQDDGDLDEFGRLLHESWRLKASLTSYISSDNIEDIYQKALQAGALGGKLLGAGGGGFFLVYVSPERRQEVLDALSNFLVVPFRFEHRGSHVTAFEPEVYSRTAFHRRDFTQLSGQ
jgi:D-glycero-alpha-D-manno-heptose-7-phosphate kinase